MKYQRVMSIKFMHKTNFRLVHIVSHLKVVSPNSFPHYFLALGCVAFTMKTLPGLPLQLIFFELEDEAACDSQTQQESEKSLHFAGGFYSASRRGNLLETRSSVSFLFFFPLLCASGGIWVIHKVRRIIWIMANKRSQDLESCHGRITRKTGPPTELQWSHGTSHHDSISNSRWFSSLHSNLVMNKFLFLFIITKLFRERNWKQYSFEHSSSTLWNSSEQK